MQLTLASLVLAAATAVSAQAPSTPPPAGAVTTYPSAFEITVVLAQKKRDLGLERRAACAGDGTLVATLKNGVLTDAKGRIGSIVANRQFQFDGPPAQAGAIYASGWSVGTNGSLAIGGSAVFYECLSGGFYNLYDKNIGAQCLPIEIDIIPCGASSAGATQVSDGQIQATSAGTKITQISDGQIQASSAGPKITQISDGQIQASSAGPKITQISDGQIQASSAVSRVPVSQYTDGQLQMPTGKPVTQISDGQIQAPTATPTKAPVTQISDGQIQAPTATITKAPVSQISDGQIQAPTSTPVFVTQISDGQIQAPNATSTKARVTANAAAAATFGAQIIAGVAAAAAGFAML